MAARLDELTRFVRDALTADIPRPQIEQALLDAGWDRDQVTKALTSFAEVDFPVPVPRPARQASAGEAFRYLVLFVALGLCAVSVGQLFFTLIEYLFADPASAGYAHVQMPVSGVRWPVADTIIAFPVFLLAAGLIARTARRDPTQRASPVRRWLTYVAMFLAVMAIIADLVTLVAYVLGGGTTARFLLKVLVVALLAGLILGYYLWDMRDSDRDRRPVARTFLGIATLTWLIAVAAGLWLMGPPSEQAARGVDDRRVQDLRTLATAVDRYYQQHSTLPPSLAEASASLPIPPPMSDPVTNARYEYAAGAGRDFELCAEFAHASGEFVPIDSVWVHGAGRQCFALTAEDAQRR